MYRHILVATDGSDTGQKALEHALSLGRDQGARITVITVSEHYPLYAGDPFGMVAGGPVFDEYEAGQEKAARAILDAAAQTAEGGSVELETIHVSNTPPAEAIIEAAQSRNCDLIVMGSHGRRGLGRLLLGSKAWEVVSHSHVPVLIVR
jgi:nucleotide-binding universal stress UspA family protein